MPRVVHHRRGTELPWLFLGRRVRPMAFGVLLFTLTIVWATIVRHDDLGVSFDAEAPLGWVVGVAASVSAGLLTVGWLVTSDRAMQLGLLIATGVLMTRWAYLGLDLGFSDPVPWRSFSVAVMAGASYLLEVTGVPLPEVRRRE